MENFSVGTSKAWKWKDCARCEKLKICRVTPPIDYSANSKTTPTFHLTFENDFWDMIEATTEAAEKAKEFFAQKLDFTINPEELNDQIEKGGKSFIVDVRETKDFIKGHIPCAINLPTGHWDKITAWRKDRPIIIYGYSELCHLATHAAKEAAEHGYTVLELEGGFEAWRKSKLAVEY